MDSSSVSTAAEIGIVGLGQQGAGIVTLLAAQGYRIAGGVDIGAKVGKRISEVVPGFEGTSTIYGSIQSLIEGTDHDLDVVVLAAAIDLETTLVQARELMRAGINVLTLQQDLFEPEEEWATELNDIGEATGASFLSTGVQDTWWVHIPTVAAASTVNIRGVQIEHLIDMESLPVGLCESFGYGVAADEFGPYKEAAEALPPILGAPLRVAAKRFGFVPSAVSMTVDPIVTDRPVRWERADRELPVGTVIGTEEVTTFSTDAGVQFRGYLRLRLLDITESPTDLVTIDADPPLRLEHKPFPGDQVTNIALVARIPDVMDAPGGVLSAATLGPAKYRRPATRVG